MTIVKSRPYSAQGATLGMNFVSYQSRPRRFSPMRRDRKPASSGMPRKMSTDRAMSHVDASMPVCSRPSHPGRTER